MTSGAGIARGRADAAALSRLHRMEAHMRENKLRATFTEQLSRAAVAEEVNSKREAKQLAFYLFWNVRQDDTK